MNYVASPGDRVATSNNAMFLNLHRINFNYAFALWNEEQGTFRVVNAPCVHNERLIVRLGNFQSSKEIDVNRNTTAGYSRVLHQCVPDQTLENVINVRLTYKSEIHDNDDISIESLSSAYANTGVKYDDDYAQNQSSFFPLELPTMSWDVLNCFPYTLSADNQNSDQHESFVEQELRKKQEALSELEIRMTPKLRELLVAVYHERLCFEGRDSIQKTLHDAQTLLQYDSFLKRKLEVATAKDSQLEIDLDAVCHVCNDGDVSPINQIIFCDSCNVAVHQNCYGIQNVPEGDFFCDACKFFKSSASRASEDERKKSLPIVCELCPCREGAFYRCHDIQPRDICNTHTEVKWCHVVCAKWQGVVFVDDNKKILEDVSAFKTGFSRRGISCCLCEGERGAYNKCHNEGCQKYMHITCARASGLCDMKHGENHEGLLSVDQNPWTLFCPDHSPLDPNRSDHMDTFEKLQKLKDAAKSFPPEPKPFECMNYYEREKYLENTDNEHNLYQRIVEMQMLNRCEVCDAFVNVNDPLMTCGVCHASFHADCFTGWKSKSSSNGNSVVTCNACQYAFVNNQKEFYEKPHCHMCNFNDGLLMESFANPMKKSKWTKGNQSQYKRSLFGKQIWCHTICAM